MVGELLAYVQNPFADLKAKRSCDYGDVELSDHLCKVVLLFITEKTSSWQRKVSR